MTPELSFLLSPLYGVDPLAPEHLADLRRSGLTDETIARHKFRSVPPGMIGHLLGFDISAIRSAYLVPFADPRGGWMDHVRMKIFPSLTTRRGTIKYLQPCGSGVRLFFPLSTLDDALGSDKPLWLVEAEKKSLAVAQLGLPSVGFCGVEGWHRSRSSDLLNDFGSVRLCGRVVELVPDGDVQTNRAVRRGVERLAAELARLGASPRLVVLPMEIRA